MKKKTIPPRVCAADQDQKSNTALIRCVPPPEGAVEIDKTGKKSGRGVYICQNSACLEKAYKEHRLERSLKTKVSDEIYESLRQELS